MIKKYMRSLVPSAVIIFLLAGCASQSSSTMGDQAASSSATGVAGSFKSFKDYPDHRFNAREYIRGMKKWGHNLLGWQDHSADLKKYSNVKVKDFDGRLLPVQNRFSYDPFIKTFNMTFKNSLKMSLKDAPDALIIEGVLVECNPGSRAARIMVGLGAGKAGGAVACEVYEPGGSSPVIRIYARDTASAGMWGGDSVAMLNHILNQVAIRLGAILETRIGR